MQGVKRIYRAAGPVEAIDQGIAQILAFAIRDIVDINAAEIGSYPDPVVFAGKLASQGLL